MNTADGSGGAAAIALSLHDFFLEWGHDAWLAVKRRSTGRQNVVQIRQESAASVLARPFWHAEMALADQQFRGVRQMRMALRMAANPQHLVDALSGREDFHYPATRQIREWGRIAPDLIHLHNLHGRYFDLRCLPEISKATPTVMTLHDAWLISGHCAHSLSCSRWQTGCGRCPDLSLYPALLRDGTAANWREKASIFARSKLFVATPSQWLMDKVQRSMLMPGIMEARVIPPGIDLATYQPGDQQLARQVLGLPLEARIVLLVGVRAQGNSYKDWKLVEAVAGRLGMIHRQTPLYILVAGDKGETRQFGHVTLQFAGSIRDAASMAQYYQAADIFLHTARAETWGLAITESLACGTPVVSTAVGGLPEQITSLSPQMKDQANGYLADAGDDVALASGIERILGDDDLRRFLAKNAARYARRYFDHERQAVDYLAWYRSILAL